MNEVVSAHLTEHDREYRGSKQDDKNHRGNRGGGDGGFAQHCQGKTPT